MWNEWTNTNTHAVYYWSFLLNMIYGPFNTLHSNTVFFLFFSILTFGNCFAQNFPFHSRIFNSNTMDHSPLIGSYLHICMQMIYHKYGRSTCNILMLQLYRLRKKESITVKERQKWWRKKTWANGRIRYKMLLCHRGKCFSLDCKNCGHCSHS